MRFPPLPILLYHRILPRSDARFDGYAVTPQRFLAQMAWLKRQGFRTVDLSTGLALVRSAQPGSERVCVVTFDDGTEDNYSQAFPILQALGFTATVFMLPQFAGQNHQGQHYLNWDQIGEMADAGWRFESHGWSHQDLTTLSEAEIDHEAGESKRLLEQRLNRPVRYFAYPFGLRSEAVSGCLARWGYEGACGGTPELDGRVPDCWNVGRTEIFQTDGALRFAFKVAHGYGPGYWLLRQGGRIRRALMRERRA